MSGCIIITMREVTVGSTVMGRHPCKLSKIVSTWPNVLPAFRRRGIGSQLLEVAERTAAAKSNQVGIGVGLYADYGAAQKLYVKRGYVPDGRGITYNYLPLAPDSMTTLDDDLVLWLIKRLQ